MLRLEEKNTSSLSPTQTMPNPGIRLPSTLSNIMLIGMPACGKSTIGRALAKVLDRPWADTDALLVKKEREPLGTLLKREGAEGFKALENRLLSTVTLRDHVISSGGSLIYSEDAMENFKSHSLILFLNTPLRELEERLKDFDKRGIVRHPNQSLASLWAERLPLYRNHADLEIDTAGLNEKELLETVLEALD